MRVIHHLARGLVVSAFAILPFCLAIPAGAEVISQVIYVLQVKGQARYSNDNKTWHALKKGESLQPGALIQTGMKSVVDLQLSDHDAALISIDSPNGSLRTPEELRANTIRLYENSVLSIGKVTIDRAGSEEVSETQLDLSAGRIMGAVRKSAAASKYEIKFINGVAGVREGIYLMKSSGEVNVLYGTTVIALEAADGSTQVKVVDANQQFDPGTGLVSEIRSPLPVEPVAANPKPVAATPLSPSPPFQGAGPGGALRKF